MKKAFTITELLVAVALMALALAGAGLVFKVSINAQRIAGATAEIMRNLRAITDQLNTDFSALRKDGFLILYSEELAGRREYHNSDPNDFRADRIYYFCTGDFQSWFDPKIRSNIARVYLGHEYATVIDVNDPNGPDAPNLPASQWYLARDVALLTEADVNVADCNRVSYSYCKANIPNEPENPFDVLEYPPEIRIVSDSNATLKADANTVRLLMCQNVGALRIEWTWSTTTDGQLDWWGFGNPVRDSGLPGAEGFADVINENEDDSVYTVQWTPRNQQYWPKAIKFTFTLYDSKDILKQGKTFTHIVYIGD